MTAVPDDVTMPTSYEQWERENIRRHVATAAMNGMLANGTINSGTEVNAKREKVANLAVKYADALLLELAK